MKNNSKLKQLPAALLAALPVGFLLFESALSLAGISDETQPSESVLESNFDLPCSELTIKESSWNPDLNILVVDVETPPLARFF